MTEIDETADRDISAFMLIGFGTATAGFLALLIFTGWWGWLGPVALFENALLAQAYCRHPYSVRDTELFAIAYFSLERAEVLERTHAND